MFKKGQVTVFIIVGVLIAAIFLALFITKQDAAKKLQEKTSIGPILLSDDALQNYIQSCIEKTAQDALLFIGEHGGYYELPPLSNSTFQLPYFFYQNKNIFL